MVKVQAIIDFNYKEYNKINNLQPVSKTQEGKLFAGDIFEANEDMAKYLTGENENKIVAVKVLEVIPEIKEKEAIQKPKKKKEAK